MATEDENKPKRRLRKPETVRERAAKPKADKPRRLQAAKSRLARVAAPFNRARQFGKREYYLPMPDNRIGRFMNKRRSVIPSYFKQSWQELRQVSWPNRKETLQLSLAVFLFALFFGLVIAIVDYGLDKLFEQLLLK